MERQVQIGSPVAWRRAPAWQHFTELSRHYTHHQTIYDPQFLCHHTLSTCQATMIHYSKVSCVTVVPTGTCDTFHIYSSIYTLRLEISWEVPIIKFSDPLICIIYTSTDSDYLKIYEYIITISHRRHVCKQH
jgi:hypothetical protein